MSELIEIDEELREFIRQDVQNEFKKLIESLFYKKRQIKAMLDRDFEYLTAEQYEVLEALYTALDKVLKEERGGGE